MKPPKSPRSGEGAGRSPARRLLLALVLLGLTAGGGALPWIAQAAPPAPETPADTTAAVSDTTGAQRVLAYYFHTTQRCASCRKIEAYTAEAITTGFAEDLKAGRLVFQAVNIEDKGNEHFVKDFNLFTKTVVLVDERSGKQTAWKSLPKVWELLNDKDRFVRYIQGETRAYLSGKPS
jgi:hypothetical protein